MKLEAILGIIGLPLEHDGLTFRLAPFSTTQVAAWQQVAAIPRSEEETAAEWHGRIRDAQVAFLAKHFRNCVTDGNKSKVTPKWVAEALPNVVLQDVAEFLVHGKRPAWAGESGN